MGSLEEVKVKKLVTEGIEVEDVYNGGEKEGTGAEAEAERGVDAGGKGEEEILVVSSSSQERVSSSLR